MAARKNLNRTDSCLTTAQFCTLLDLFDDYTNIRDVQKAVRHRTQLTENTSFDYSVKEQTTSLHVHHGRSEDKPALQFLLQRHALSVQRELPKKLAAVVPHLNRTARKGIE